MLLLALATAALVAWRPHCLFTLLAALLPLDLAPWSGRLLIDEYDAVLAAGLVVASWRSRGVTPLPDRPASLLLLALLALYALGAARPLWPWVGLAPDAFANPLEPLNGLRIAKAAFWAALAWGVARRQQAAGVDVVAAWGRGMVLGLLGTVVFIVGERWAFSSLLDVRDGYRVAGPFAAMHTGGAYVEAWLVAALPFLLVFLWSPRRWRWLLGAALLLASVYALMVTFSRGGYAALLAVLLLMGGFKLRQSRARGQHPRWPAAVLAGVVLGGLVLAVALPILGGQFARSRLATVDADLQIREQHWQQVVQLAEDAGGSIWWGLGVGRLPALALLHGVPDMRSGSFSLVDDAGQRALRLGTGGALYIDQQVAAQPATHYRVHLRLRGLGPGAALTVALCEKWLIASATCSAVTATPDSVGRWQSLELALDSAAVGAASPLRPLKLSLSLAGSAAVDVAALQLLDEAGQPLLRNGDFQAGLDGWFFTADNHLAWHAKSMPLGLLFDLGLPGLLLTGALLALAWTRALPAAWQGQPGAAALAVALLAFSIVGSIDTLLDTPRFLMLWLLLCLFAAGTGRGSGSTSALRLPVDKQL